MTPAGMEDRTLHANKQKPAEARQFEATRGKTASANTLYTGQLLESEGPSSVPQPRHMYVLSHTVSCLHLVHIPHVI